MLETGNNKAASMAADLMNHFQSIKYGLLVGIGGGLPSYEDDIRLGDLVVGIPQGTNSGVIPFGMAKGFPGNHFEQTGLLNKPPDLLLSFVQRLRSRHLRENDSIPQILSKMAKDGYKHPGSSKDVLFHPNYIHEPGSTCAGCDKSYVVQRETRPYQVPHIHYGTIGSSNVVIKDGMLRDTLKKELHLLCVEMEAAGVGDLRFLTIRGISDYADSHKNKEWQPYAAAVAAAYVKDLLSMFPPTPELNESLTQVRSPVSQHGQNRNAKVEMKAEKIFYHSTFSSSGPMHF
ncbi:hypothetical protein PENSTE_c002G06819 [Penicillium steckii]|uniref:Nucleoside phosphorylase domain-containing protein n=1 Tax=Penicillium steckii TaxID=303698 RepID=A0A1V6TUF7_9EURO|nr:hypothetical protein PENSTE_c002G06819 [Penicillium steckii]